MKTEEMQTEEMQTEKLRTEKAQLPYAHWLYNVPGLGRKTIQYLLSEKETPEALYHTEEQELEKLLSILPGKQKLAQRITASKQNWNIEKAYDELVRRGIGFTCLGDTAYPKRLARIPDAPYALYFRESSRKKNGRPLQSSVQEDAPNMENEWRNILVILWRWQEYRSSAAWRGALTDLPKVRPFLRAAILSAC